MSHIKNPEVIFEQMRRKKIRLYQVFDTDKKSVLDEVDLSDNLTVEESINQLQETLSNVDGIVYIVIRLDDVARKRTSESAESSSKIDNYKGVFKYTLKVGENTDGKQGFIGGNAMLPFILNLMKENQSKEIQMLQQKYELERQFNERILAMEKKLDKRSNSESSQFEEQITKLIEAVLANQKNNK